MEPEHEVQKIDPLPLETLGELPDVTIDPHTYPTNPMESQPESEDEFSDIGTDALLPLLKSVRKVVASDAFQKRLIKRVDDLFDIPYFPDALEADSISRAYDLIQEPATHALDDWIEELQQ